MKPFASPPHLPSGPSVEFPHDAQPYDPFPFDGFSNPQRYASATPKRGRQRVTLLALFLLSYAACAYLSSSPESPAEAGNGNLISSAHAKPRPAPRGFDLALADYKAGHTTAAYAQFMRLADAGDPESARIALILLRHGPELHGTAWGASQPQINNWMRLARTPMDPIVAESGD